MVIPHTSFCSALHYQLSYLGLTTESRVFDFASYSFDVAVHNTLATFVAGGCVCIPLDTDRKDDPTKAMAAMNVTWADLTPSVAQLIQPNQIPSLKTLVLLGEAVTTDVIAAWWSKVQIINTYGPAECTPISLINWDSSDPRALLKIGKGEGVVTWVVDADNHDILLAAGQVGELLLEGPDLGKPASQKRACLLACLPA